ncbi:ATP-binding protein [Rhodoferax sp.]|uniref:ATP-binding protein n=1 Tax=Rhodoferax sp. TaxID=50421 RepID=UPI0028460EF0|nr:ATP-binding protein [Rhodoferax sp.]MDR3371337.1 ATP-binding protein [Rhodoferax sp.]
MIDSDNPADTPPSHPNLPRWYDLLRQRGLLTVVLVELLMAALVAYGLWDLRRQTLQSELRTLESLSVAMAAQANSTLEVADTVLRATRAELGTGLLAVDDREAHALLVARAAALPQFRSLNILDDQGMRVASSRNDQSVARSMAQRDFFVTSRALDGSAIFVGSPFVRKSDGQTLIGVAIDWRNPMGEFGGVVTLVADPEFLDGDFLRIAPTPDAHMAIYRRDRQLVSDGPGQNTNQLLPAEVLASLLTPGTVTKPRQVALPDGQQRLVALQPLQHFDLVVLIMRDVTAVLTEWTEQAWLVGSFSASALLITFLLTLRHAREKYLRHASQAELAAEKERAVRAFQAAQEGYWEWNPEQRESHMSPRMRELLGLERGAEQLDQPGLLAQGHVHPDDLAPLRAAFLAHEQGREAFFDVTFRVRQADGQWHHVRARGQARRDDQGRVLLFTGTGADVTTEVQAQEQTRSLEDQLHNARKLEAVGTLAGAIAHDFNNILAAVQGYGELAADVAEPGSRQAHWIAQMVRGGERGKALVKRILAFSQPSSHQRSVFRLAPVIHEMLDLLTASVPENIQLRRSMDAVNAQVRGDSTQVYEAVMNLCTNAVHAMQQGGTLGVALSELHLEQSLLLSEKTLNPGHYACLTVTDTGHGMTPEVKSRLFEPFFTTRGPQQGTGLGLTVVRAVMVDMEGAVDVQSVPGVGSRFTLYFPWVDAPLSDAGLQQVEPSHHGKGQTILVVDDEWALVEMAEDLLAGLGYEAIGFGSATLALQEFSANPDRFDALMTDERMPDMSGCDLALAVHALRPNLPVLLVSGYGGAQLQERATAAGVAVIVSKPMGRAELAAALLNALAQETASLAKPQVTSEIQHPGNVHKA